MDIIPGTILTIVVGSVVLFVIGLIWLINAYSGSARENDGNEIALASSRNKVVFVFALYWALGLPLLVIVDFFLIALLLD
jgi:hypothetical protein